MTASSPLQLRLVETGYAALARPLLFRLDAERVHHATLSLAQGMGTSAVGRRVLGTVAGGPAAQEGQEVRLWGLRFAHAVGLGAGMDKDARAVPAWSALGFSHVEVGTVTARPQPGNPRPRLMRLPRSRAIVNRMGFNNRGATALAETLRRAREAGLVDIPVGVSIGKTKTTPVHDAVDDYLTSVGALTGLADYFAVNVSSPNTPGLRGLQDREPLEQLLRAVVRAAGGTPVLVKLAPDLDDAALEDAIEVATGSGAAGLVATNTTTSRPVELLHPSERHTAGQEAGGLSGAPLTARSRQVVARVAQRTDLPVIGVGGIMTGADARAMLDAGASLVQLYSGLVYRGPALVGEAVRA